ncbi:hypothetical protein [Aquimarina sediminis]|uniref:hypothetical protein n=1 Tax=Aquimarina sediminis TaxID=2070536 RepID=UPI000CA017AD|nr:hypothetical protein [Aquimarina sediminis]
MYSSNIDIEKIEDYNYSSCGLLYIKNNNLFLNHKKLLVLKDDYELKSSFFYNLLGNKIQYIDKECVVKEIELESEIHFSIVDQNNIYMKFYSGGLFDQTFGIFSLKEKKILFETNEFIGNIVFEDKIFNNNNNNIIARKVFDGKPIWVCQVLNKKGFKANRTSTELNSIEVTSFLGVYDNTLWMVLNNGFLLGVDIDTGKEKHYLGYAIENNTERGWYEDLGHVYISSQYKLDSNTGKIILISGEDYFEVDLNKSNPKKVWRNMASSLKGLQCEMGGNEGFKFDDNYFYFYDGPKGVVIVMDRNNFEIVWNHDLKIQTEDSFVLSLLRDLKISEGKIGVLDRNNTLHIFEKESA